MIRSVVLDNQPQNREALSRLIAEHFKNVEVIGTLGLEDCLETILTQKPDLVFIDADTEGSVNPTLLKTLRSYHFDIIFTTASRLKDEQEQYAMAIKAIKYSALDYINRPFNIDELKSAIRKFEDKRSSADNGNEANLIYFDNEKL